jgi:predicted nucleic acid-binding protein
MIAIDTNLLVYAHRNRTPEHRSAVAAIERAVALHKGWGIALPSIGEFWSVVTHRNCPPRPSTPEDARAFLVTLLATGQGETWVPGPGFGERLISAAASLGVSGARIFDLQIALLAFEGGATELWSHDAKFMSVPGLPVHDPLRH